MSKNNKDFFKEKKIWSIVKDELLGCYLVPYFCKLISTQLPILYVDCFAGKGKFDDGKNGSPLVAIECLNRSLEMSSEKSSEKKEPKVFLRFIELYHADALRKNIPNEHKRETEVIEGAFEENIVDLLGTFVQRYKKLNVFLYVDPYGIKSLNMSVFRQLPEVFSSAELLINLNSFGFLREALRVRKIALRENEDELLAELDEYEPSIVQSVEDLNRIAGGDYWKKIVDKYKTKEIDIDAAEKQFAEEYKKVLRKSFKYTLDMPIRLHAANKPKYRMVYSTNHPDGCVLMADNISKRTEYLVIDIQQHGQMSLFMQTAENELITPELIDDQMEKLIQSKYKSQAVSLSELQADFFNTYGVICSPKDLSSGQSGSSLKRLEEKGKIEVNRIPSTKKGKPTRFWCVKKNQKISIKGK